MYKETQEQCVLNITLVRIIKTRNLNLNHRNKRKKRKDRKPITRHAIINMLTQVQHGRICRICCTNLEEVNESREKRRT